MRIKIKYPTLKGMYPSMFLNDIKTKYGWKEVIPNGVVGDYYKDLCNLHPIEPFRYIRYIVKKYPYRTLTIILMIIGIICTILF
jgi:hypothetical protein